MVVELGSSNLSTLTAFRKEGECVSSILDADFFEALDEDTLFI
jgi:hypothetical protein